MDTEILLLTCFMMVMWLFFTIYALTKRSMGMAMFSLICAGVICAFANFWIGIIAVLFSAILLIANAVGVRI